MACLWQLDKTGFPSSPARAVPVGSAGQPAQPSASGCGLRIREVPVVARGGRAVHYVHSTAAEFGWLPSFPTVLVGWRSGGSADSPTDASHCKLQRGSRFPIAAWAKSLQRPVIGLEPRSEAPLKSPEWVGSSAAGPPRPASCPQVPRPFIDSPTVRVLRKASLSTLMLAGLHCQPRNDGR